VPRGRGPGAVAAAAAQPGRAPPGPQEQRRERGGRASERESERERECKQRILVICASHRHVTCAPRQDAESRSARARPARATRKTTALSRYCTMKIVRFLGPTRNYRIFTDWKITALLIPKVDVNLNPFRSLLERKSLHYPLPPPSRFLHTISDTVARSNANSFQACQGAQGLKEAC